MVLRHVMMTRRASAALLVLFLATSLFAAAPRPDLVVVVSIDQFPYHYLPRFEPWFAPAGFNRFLQNGADFRHALYPYATLHTGPGHASIGTGQLPPRTGIVANYWFDRRSGKSEYCVEDPRAAGYSPLNLDSDSLGDRLQEKFIGSKVLSISLKDRAAILMGGQKATAAYWLDRKSGGFTTSAYYRAANRAFIESFNSTIPALVRSHPMWEQSSFIPAADLARITHDPPSLRKFKHSRGGMGVAFPHRIANLEELTYTPFGNDLVLAFALQLLDLEKIGTNDGQPDLLFVSLSSTDYLGHDYGPDSLEIADDVVRTDRQLERFFAELDARFGDRYVLALSADHGVQSIPEVARDMGREAGRVDMRDPRPERKTFGELVDARRRIEKLAAEKLGLEVSDATPIGRRLILEFEDPAIYINWPRLAEAKLDGEKVKRALRDAAVQIRGIGNAFTNTELMVPNPNASGVELAVRNSFRADRSGDVILALRAGYIFDYGTGGTTHGYPVEDDQHVPLLLWGRGIKPGHYDAPAAPTDLARTLGALLGVDAGGAQSAVLPCVE